MVPHADYQSICVTWLPRISFPFSFICLAATVYSGENWKLKPWRARERYSKGKMGLSCCMIGMVHLGGGWEWSDLFLMSSEECFEKSREATYGHLHLLRAVFVEALSICERYWEFMWASCLIKEQHLSLLPYIKFSTMDGGMQPAALRRISFSTADRGTHEACVALHPFQHHGQRHTML